jgi:hypothetical protein
LHFDKNTAKQVATKRLCRHTKKKYKSKVLSIVNGKEMDRMLTYSMAIVALPEMSDVWLNAVIVEGWGDIPTVLLTNLEVDQENPLTLLKVVESYLTRWKCDECFRYIKQSYNTEDVRVRSYNGLRNIIAIVHAIAYFTSIYIGINVKLKIMIEKIYIISKRFFGIPNFFNYAMADGIYNLLKSTKTDLVNFIKVKPPPNFQLNLFPY